jgi:hypothetical protein
MKLKLIILTTLILSSLAIINFEHLAEQLTNGQITKFRFYNNNILVLKTKNQETSVHEIGFDDQRKVAQILKEKECQEDGKFYLAEEKTPDSFYSNINILNTYPPIVEIDSKKYELLNLIIKRESNFGYKIELYYLRNGKQFQDNYYMSSLQYNGDCWELLEGISRPLVLSSLREKLYLGVISEYQLQKVTEGGGQNMYSMTKLKFTSQGDAYELNIRRMDVLEHYEYLLRITACQVDRLYLTDNITLPQTYKKVELRLDDNPPKVIVDGLEYELKDLVIQDEYMIVLSYELNWTKYERNYHMNSRQFEVCRQQLENIQKSLSCDGNEYRFKELNGMNVIGYGKIVDFKRGGELVLKGDTKITINNVQFDKAATNSVIMYFNKYIITKDALGAVTNALTTPHTFMLSFGSQNAPTCKERFERDVTSTLNCNIYNKRLYPKTAKEGKVRPYIDFSGEEIVYVTPGLNDVFSKNTKIDLKREKIELTDFGRHFYKIKLDYPCSYIFRDGILHNYTVACSKSYFAFHAQIYNGSVLRFVRILKENNKSDSYNSFRYLDINQRSVDFRYQGYRIERRDDLVILTFNDGSKFSFKMESKCQDELLAYLKSREVCNMIERTISLFKADGSYDGYVRLDDNSYVISGKPYYWQDENIIQKVSLKGHTFGTKIDKLGIAVLGSSRSLKVSDNHFCKSLIPVRKNNKLK